MAKFVKNEVEKCSIEKAEMDNYASQKKIVGCETNVEGVFLPQKIDSARSSSPQTDRSDDKKTNPKVDSTFTCSDESEICDMIAVPTRRGAGAIEIDIITALQHHRRPSETIPNPVLTFWHQ